MNDFNFYTFIGLFVAFVSGMFCTWLHYTTAMVARGIPDSISISCGYDHKTERVIILTINKHMRVTKECVALLSFTEARHFSAAIDKACDENQKSETAEVSK